LKFFVAVLLIFFLPGIASAQIRDTIYLDKDWKKSTATNYSFYRIITHAGNKLNVEDYYRSGHLQMQGSYTSLSPKEIEDGHFNYYAENGVKTRDETFKAGLNEGDYLSWDTAGHLLLKMYFRHDKWDGHRTAYYSSGAVRRDEVYTNGVFITGECFDEKGNEVKFFPMEELPAYPSGEAALFLFLHSHLAYPPAAQKKGIQGTVKVKFVIDTTGHVGDIAILQSDNAALNDAAMDVVRQLPAFTPARQEGVAVRCPYLLPVVFRLAEK
jgi:TonB family protein